MPRVGQTGRLPKPDPYWVKRLRPCTEPTKADDLVRCLLEQIDEPVEERKQLPVKATFKDKFEEEDRLNAEWECWIKYVREAADELREELTLAQP